MKTVLILAAAGEALTGLALLVVPSLVGWLLLGEELIGAGIVAGRILGMALIAFSLACWPGPPAAGMMVYGAAVTLYLGYVGSAGGMTGILLWPAVVAHLALMALLAWTSIRRS
jgi:hypothetical protein